MSTDIPNKLPQPDDLKKLAKKIKNQGREKGLTDKELEDRKNLHKDSLFTCLVWGFRVLLIIIGIWIIILLGLYTWILAHEQEYFKTVIENIIKAAIAGLAALSLNHIIPSLFKRKR